MTNPPNDAADHNGPSKVGTVFAHEYYTFLSKDPARLYCFYNKNSTMSHGVQGSDTQICQGQQAIRAKILDLGFEDCKVLVSDLDCQASHNNGIIIQILGEMSNKGGPAQKFAQTFFLAEQPQGYYVLNDIFRYLKDDTDDDEYPKEAEDVVEEPAAPQPIDATVPQTAPKEEHTAAPTSAPSVHVEPIPLKVEAAQEKSAPILIPVEEGKPTEKHADKKTDKKADKKDAQKNIVKSDEGKQEVTEPANKEDVLVTEPAKKEGTCVTDAATPIAEPTFSPPPAAQTFATAQTFTPALAPTLAPTHPPKLKTWANLAANNSSQWGTHVASAKAAIVTTPPPAPAKPQSTPQATTIASTPRPQGRPEYHSIYIKNVTERMTLPQLREAFSKFGTVKHLELTQKKNCAFLDFSTPEAMHAALKQNMVEVGNDVVLAEERRRGGGLGNQSAGRGGFGQQHHNASNGHGHGQHQQQQQGGAGSRGGRINNPRKPVQNKSEKFAQPAVVK
ncbi:hypothetical protein BC939DRAFT_476653 [Gamsiella multidivaricata]|uniref:uncharacterized protein n=1 Tax=Gamsiella multidivaricata TaxID=101098 RepID=UPI00221EE564|nr:uncharacterized protein BC939DRAFT_476653 [Gamsiella multidivaricata]KAG0371386.1 hypothetical protein BGZ54_000013 [Gamsiella multidivaricata]KAI7824681.1 hypothetical protein BC939DRAFT_476653 [Gamsiella multidivaricata]